jgi:HEAT repeat protein
LNDPDLAVRVAAAQALSQVGGPRQAEAVAPVLAEGLKAPEVELRRSAAAALGRLDPKPDDLAAALETALEDDDPMTRLNAAEALCGLPGHADKGAGVLAEALDNPGLRFPALAILSRVGPAAGRAVPALVALLEQSNNNLVGQAAHALARVGGAAAVGPLMKVVNEGDARVRSEVVAALAAVGPAGVEPLAGLLKSNDARTRGASVRALGTLSRDDPGATAALLDALKSDDIEVRLVAVQSLGRLGSGPEADRLAALLKDPERSVAVEAAMALAPSRGAVAASALPVLLATADDRNHPDRLRAIEALGMLGPLAAPAVPTLVRALTEEGPARSRSVQALGRIGPAAKEAVPALREALLSPQASTRARAAIALWEVDRLAREAVPALIEAVQSPALRGNAFSSQQEMYSTMMPKTSMPPRFNRTGFGTALPWDDPGASRREAIEALGRMKSEARAAVPALADAAKEVDDAIRRAAIEALKAIDPVFPSAG